MTAYLTASEAAAQLRIHRNTLLNHARAGRIRGSNNGIWRFEQSALDEFVAGGSNTVAAPATPERRRRRRAA